jgi:hypothetical protein
MPDQMTSRSFLDFEVEFAEFSHHVFIVLCCTNLLQKPEKPAVEMSANKYRITRKIKIAVDHLQN